MKTSDPDSVGSTIPHKWSRKGYTYELVTRTQFHAIYSQTHQLHAYPCAFELVKIKVRKARNTPRFTVEAGEYLPTDAKWGSAGWTFSTLDGARARLNRLEASSATPSSLSLNP